MMTFTRPTLSGVSTSVDTPLPPAAQPAGEAAARYGLDPDRLYGGTAVASVIGVAPSTALSMVRAAGLPSIHLTSREKFRGSVLISWLDSILSES